MATTVVTTPTDQPSLAATILGMEKTIGLQRTVLADAGYASGAAVAELQARRITPLMAIGRTQPHRLPPPAPRTEEATRHRRSLAHRDESQFGERMIVALAYNCRRLRRLRQA